MSIEERIRVTGADQAERDVRGVADATEDVGEATEQTGGKARAAEGPVSELGAELRNMALAHVGIEKLTQAFQVLKQDLIETAEAAKGFAESFRDLQFLSEEFDPRTRKFVGAAAAVAGRGMQETAEAFAEFKSKLPELDQTTQMQAFLEVAELGRTTAGPLTGLVAAYASIANVTGERDPQKTQNIIAKLKELAPETDVAAIGESIAEPLAAGQAAGLTTAETLGLTEVIAKKVADQRKGATAARSFILALGGRGTPEGQKVLKRVGAEPGADVLETLDLLSQAYAAGEVSTADVEALFGREVVAGGLAAITGADLVRDFTAQIQAAAAGGRDITTEMVNKQLAADEITRLTFAIATTDAEIEIEKVTGEHAADALAMELERKRLELSGRQRGEGAVRRAVERGLLVSEQAVGGRKIGLMPVALEKEDVSGYRIGDVVEAVRQGGVDFDPQRGGVRINVTNIGSNYMDNNPERLSEEIPDVSD